MSTTTVLKKTIYFSCIPFCYSQLHQVLLQCSSNDRLSKSVSISCCSLQLNPENRTFSGLYSQDFKYKTPKHPQKLSYFPSKFCYMDQTCRNVSTVTLKITLIDRSYEEEGTEKELLVSRQAFITGSPYISPV